MGYKRRIVAVWVNKDLFAISRNSGICYLLFSDFTAQKVSSCNYRFFLTQNGPKTCIILPESETSAALTLLT